MNTTEKLPTTMPFERPTKDAVLRVRCSKNLKTRIQQMAACMEKDASDLLREAMMEKVLAFEQRRVAA